eukprot:7386163-Prymnesium_polylepis.1
MCVWHAPCRPPCRPPQTRRPRPSGSGCCAASSLGEAVVRLWQLDRARPDVERQVAARVATRHASRRARPTPRTPHAAQCRP